MRGIFRGLTLVEVFDVFGFVVASVPSVGLTVLAGFDDEDEVAARLVFIVVCISLHRIVCSRVKSLVMVQSGLSRVIL